MNRNMNLVEKWESLLFFFLAIFFSSCTDELDTTINPSKNIESVDLAHVDGEGKVLKFSIPELENCNIVLEDWMYLLEGLPAVDDENLQIWVTRNTGEKMRKGKILFNFSNGQNKTYTLEQDALSDLDTGIGVSESKVRFGVGYGIDLSREFSTQAIRGEVFKVMNLYDKGIIQMNTAEQSTQLIEYSGETKREIGTKLSIEASASGEYSGFSGETKAAFTMENTESSNNQYSIITFSSNKGIYTIDPSIVDYDGLMTQNAIDCINSPNFNAAKLFRHFGTHVVMSAYEGARFNYNMTLDREKVTSNVGISGFAKAAYKNLFVEAKVEVTAEEKRAYEENKMSCKTKSRTVGGPENSSDLINEGKSREWMSLIKQENWAMIGSVNGNSLKPIWEFAKTNSRKNEIKQAAIAYINSKWEPENKKTIKITIPTFDKTLVKTVRVDGIPYVEVCNEYIPEISREKRQTVLYAINIKTGKVNYKQGFLIGNANTKPSWIFWGDEKIIEIRPIAEYPIGALKTIYACGSHFSNLIYNNAIQGRIMDEYSVRSYEHAENKEIGLVKLGTRIFARDNTYFKVNLQWKPDSPLSNCSGRTEYIDQYQHDKSFIWENNLMSERFYGQNFAHRNNMPGDETLWGPILPEDFNRAAAFSLDKDKWLVGAVSGLDLKFDGHLFEKINDRRGKGTEDVYWCEDGNAVVTVYRDNKDSRIDHPSGDNCRRYGASIRFMRRATFFYN